MKFSAADQTAMLTATGQTITIDATPEVGKFKLAGKLVQMFDGSIATTGPTLIVSETVAATITRNSTIIEIDDVQYQATSKTADGAGFFELELSKDF